MIRFVMSITIVCLIITLAASAGAHQLRNQATSTVPKNVVTMPADNAKASSKEVNFANYVNPNTFLLNQIIDSFNQKDMALFENVFTKDYSFFTPFNSEVTSQVMLKNFWEDMFSEKGSLRSNNFSELESKIEAPFPGAAFVKTLLKFQHGDKEMRGLMTLNMKFDNEGWKATSLQFSSFDLVQGYLEKQMRKTIQEELEHHYRNHIRLLISFAIGLIIGSAIMFAYQHRKKKNSHK